MTPLAPSRSLCRIGAMALALALAGCADRRELATASVPDDYRARHPIVVTEAEEAIEIPVASSETGLSLSAKSRVEAFGNRFLGSESSVLRVGVPTGSWNEAAAKLAAEDAVRVLRKRGIGHGRVIVGPFDARGLEGPVPIRLSYSALAARTAPCGNWPEDLGNTMDNREYHNFGCASQQNLAAQIADPRDLLAPRGMSEIDAQRRTEMLGKYRRGERTGAAAPASDLDYSW